MCMHAACMQHAVLMACRLMHVLPAADCCMGRQVQPTCHRRCVAALTGPWSGSCPVKDRPVPGAEAASRPCVVRWLQLRGRPCLVYCHGCGPVLLSCRPCLCRPSRNPRASGCPTHALVWGAGCCRPLRRDVHKAVSQSNADTTSEPMTTACRGRWHRGTRASLTTWVWTSHWFIPCLLPKASMNLTADQPRAVRSPYFLTSIATSNSYAGNMQLMHESRQHFVIALHHPHCEF